MDRHALKVLEFDKILRLLAKYITSEPGHQALLKIYPSDNLEEISLRQAETSEMKEVLANDPTFTLASLQDLWPIFKKVTPSGAILSPVEIWSVEELILESKRLKNYFHNREKIFPKLQGKCQRLIELSELSFRIRKTVSAQGMILDEASWRLSSIRQRLKSIREQIRVQLEAVISSHLHLVREPIITIRHNRYVIPLKPEFKKRFSGIILDQSASGVTVFVEPAEIINMNNRLIQLQLNEEEEIRRILVDITEKIKAKEEDLKFNQGVFADLDLTLAKARFSYEFDGCEAELSQSGYLDIRKGRHPLLLVKIGGKEAHRTSQSTSNLSITEGSTSILTNFTRNIKYGEAETDHKVVPLDIEIGSRFKTLLITGPNAGGKTVALKTIGLLALMFQSGMHITAAEGTKLPVFKGIYADIGDEQSIEQNLSTFSAHLINISNIVRDSDNNSLILLDELGAGTDPEEGAALGISILKHLHAKGGLTIATTHYNSLKYFVFLQPDMENASVEYDTLTLQPTYRLLTGQIGRSNALSVATRAGLNEAIIAGAKEDLKGREGQVEYIIGELEEAKGGIQQELLALEEEKSKIEKLKGQQKEIIQVLEKEKRKLKKEFEEEKERFFAETRQEIREIIAQIRKQATEAPNIIFPAERLNQLSKGVMPTLHETIGEQNLREPDPVKIKRGDRVRVEELKLTGTVIEDPLNEENVVIEVGSRRLKIPQNKLEIISPHNYESPSGKIEKTRKPSYLLESEGRVDAVNEINLIGQTLEEACTKVDKFLDNAILQELSGVRIIHGRGTGKLRKGIWEMLKSHPLVKSIHFADLRHGGTAVTYVEFDN